MMLGLVLISMFVGGIAAVLSLLTSGSFVLALVVFMSAGSLTVFVLAAIIFLVDYLGRKLVSVTGRSMGAWTAQSTANQKI